MDNYHVVKSTKSVGIGILLTFLLGPIGLFYSSVWGGIIMTFCPIIVGSIFLLGLYSGSELLQIMAGVTILVYLVLWWLICIIWSVIAVNHYNRRIMKKSTYNIPFYPRSTSTESPSYLESYTQQLTSRQTSQLPEQNLNNNAQNIQTWLKANPNKGINDYYMTFKK
jgi:amino acid transporter